MHWLYLRRALSALGRGGRATCEALLQAAERVASPAPASALVVLLIGFFFTVGYLGRDFGVHWDEWYHVKVVASCINRLSLLPDGYSYGGLYFTLGFPVVFGEEIEHLRGMLHDLRTLPWELVANVDAWPAAQLFKASASQLVHKPEYILKVRAVFVAVSAPAILWTFLAVLRILPGRHGAALAAAAFVAFSWELGYHARWVAIDAPLLQFCALELFLLCGAWHARTRTGFVRWYYGAAAVAGLAFACKLNGTFALLPVLATAVLRRDWRLGERVRLLAVASALFLALAFVFSPAGFLEPLKFLAILRTGTSDYNRGGPFDSRYVSGYVEHTARLALWFLAAVPSPVVVVAALFSAVALLGFAALARRESRMTIACLTMVVGFMAVFAHNKALIVRQYLMFIPFMALCFGRGVALVWDFLSSKDRKLSLGFVVLLVAGMVGNGAIELRRALRVTRDTPATVAGDVAHDLLADRRPVRMSRAVLDILRARIEHVYQCRPVKVGEEPPSHFISMAVEHEWKSNRVRGFRRVYGADEVNMNYYAPWFGRLRNERMVDVSIDVVSKLGREMSVDMDCFPRSTTAAVRN
jgi:hypothetical protein